MAALDVASALTSIRTMLSGLSAWQTICGVSTAAKAAERIHYGAVDELDESTLSPCIILDVTSLPANWLGNRLQGEVTFEMRFYLEMPDSKKASFGDQYLWAWQQFSAMLDAINGAVGDAGEAMIQSLSVPLMPGRIDPDENGGLSEWNFILSLGLHMI